MLVIAKVRGYFDAIREPGEKFIVPDGEKATWFEPVEKPKEAKDPTVSRKKGTGEGEQGSESDKKAPEKGEGAGNEK